MLGSVSLFIYIASLCGSLLSVRDARRSLVITPQSDHLANSLPLQTQNIYSGAAAIGLIVVSWQLVTGEKKTSFNIVIFFCQSLRFTTDPLINVFNICHTTGVE